MSNKLGGFEEQELQVLALLKSGPGLLQEKIRQGLQLPRRLLDFAMLRRDGSGRLALLPAGERLLFQVRCVRTLKSFEPGSAPLDDADARAWLKASRFLDCREGLITVSRRGREWLASLESPERTPD